MHIQKDDFSCGILTISNMYKTIHTYMIEIPDSEFKLQQLRRQIFCIIMCNHLGEPWVRLQLRKIKRDEDHDLPIPIEEIPPTLLTRHQQDITIKIKEKKRREKRLLYKKQKIETSNIGEEGNQRRHISRREKSTQTDST